MSDQFGDLLRRADNADVHANDELFALLYDELRRLADRHLRSAGAGLTLSTTTLVHETYLSMSGRGGNAFPDRGRFFAYASRAMRGLVIDYARRRSAKKRDRGFEITLADDAGPGRSDESAEGLEALGQALEALAGLDPTLAELVDMHFFGGFAFVEIADLRGVSERTVQRDWRKARLLLHQTLNGEADGALSG